MRTDLPTQCLMLGSGLRNEDRLTHKVFDAGVRFEEAWQRLRFGVTQQGETVQLNDIVNGQGGRVLDLETITNPNYQNNHQTNSQKTKTKNHQTNSQKQSPNQLKNTITKPTHKHNH